MYPLPLRKVRSGDCASFPEGDAFSSSVRTWSTPQLDSVAGFSVFMVEGDRDGCDNLV